MSIPLHSKEWSTLDTRFMELFDNIINSTVFKDVDVLTKTIPDEEAFLHREKEMSEIALRIYPIILNQKPSHFLIHGNQGTGKTTTVNFTLSKLLEKCNEKGVTCYYIYINCGWDGYNNNSTVLSHIANSIDSNIGFKKAGLSRNHARMLFEEALNNKNARNLVIVLDEVDKLLSGRSGNDGLIYYFTRIKDVKEFEHINLSLITISNKANFRDYIENPSTLSSFGNDVIKFRIYDYVQLYDILKKRAELAFNEGIIEEGVLNKIASIVAYIDADCRKALKLLEKCGKYAISKNLSTITLDMVETCFNEMEEDLFLECIKNLTMYQKILLLSILHCHKKNAPYSEYVYQLNDEITKKKKKPPLSKRQLRNFMVNLESIGIFKMEITWSKKINKRTTIFNLTLKEETIDSIMDYLEKDIENFGG